MAILGEVVIVLLKKHKVGSEVGRFRCFAALCARTHAIMEVVPDVRASQVDRSLFGTVAGCHAELTWVDF